MIFLKFIRLDDAGGANSVAEDGVALPGSDSSNKRVTLSYASFSARIFTSPSAFKALGLMSKRSASLSQSSVICRTLISSRSVELSIFEAKRKQVASDPAFSRSVCNSTSASAKAALKPATVNASSFASLGSRDASSRATSSAIKLRPVFSASNSRRALSSRGRSEPIPPSRLAMNSAFNDRPFASAWAVRRACKAFGIRRAVLM